MLNEWQPRQFLTSVLDMDVETFLAGYRETHFLLVDIEDASDRLVSGLFHTSPLVRHDTPLVEEHTGATDMRLLRGAGPRPKRERASEASALAMEILSDPSMASRFLAPISHRMGGPGRRGITVGRNLGNDVILKHQSISRVHASFELSESGVVTLTDLDSKNGTWIGSTRLIGSQPVNNGETIKFGQIEAVLCDAEVLWQIVHPDISTLSSPWRR